MLNLIKQFLSLVCTLFGSELEITGKRYTIRTDVLFSVLMVNGCRLTVHQSAHDPPWTSRTCAEYCQLLGSR